MLVRVIACCLAIPAIASAQSCPDIEVYPVESRIIAHGTMDCDNPAAGLIPHDVGTTVHGCPTVIIVEPPYYDTRYRRGCGTYPRLDERLPVVAYAFTCKVDYFLFIPISSNCVLADKRVIGNRRSYEAVRCAPVGNGVGEES